MFNFANKEPENMGDLVPRGTLAWAVVSLREKKQGKIRDDGSPGTLYYDLEFTIEGGPFNRRKIFSIVSDPSDPNVKEEARSRAVGNMKRMLESSGLLTPQTAQQFTNVHPDTVMQWLSGKRVAIKVGVQKGSNGYADKNSIGEFLSPNPESGAYKTYQQLVSPTPQAPAAGGGFGAQVAAPGPFGAAPPAGFPSPQGSVGGAPSGFTSGAPAGAGASGFGAPVAPPSAPASPVSGIVQSQGFGSPAPGFQPPQAPPGATTAANTSPGASASPSSAPAWLAAGNGGGFGAAP